jgi:hypothetical protein
VTTVIFMRVPFWFVGTFLTNQGMHQMGLKIIKMGEARDALEFACDDASHHQTARAAWFDCGSQEGNLTLALISGWIERHPAKGMWLCPECSRKRDARTSAKSKNVPARSLTSV